MKYSFEKDIPYEFKELTGLEPQWRIGMAIVEDGKVIGGIAYQEDILPIMEPPVSVFSICGIEILPEFRGQGKGTAILKDLISRYDCINAAVQEGRAWEWWKRLGAQIHTGVMHPDDMGNPDAKAHTLCFVIGQTPFKTMILRALFHRITQMANGGVDIKGQPEFDFSKNK